MTKTEHVDKIIQNHILYAMGLGIVPIPIYDIIGVAAVQLDMLSQIGKVYGKPFSDIAGKSFIASVTGTSLARVGASLIKLIPGVGSIIGGVSMSIMSGASTYALGQVCKRFFDDDIDLENIDEDLAKNIYEQELEKGKKVASDLKQKAEKEKKTTPTATSAPAKAEEDIYTQLLKLGELKEKGVITDEEFQKMKKALVDKF